MSGRKITQLKAEAFRRISAIEIDTAGNPVVTISGENGVGKSSVIDSIYWTMKKFRKVKGDEIVNRGAEYTHTVLKFDDGLVVERTEHKTGKHELVVYMEPDGTTFKNAQTNILDKMFGQNLDPTEMLLMKDKEMLDLLLETYGLGKILSPIEYAHKEIYQKRTMVGRDRDNCKVQSKIPEKVEHIDVSQLVIKKDAIENVGRQRTNATTSIQDLNKTVLEKEKKIQELMNEIEFCQKQIIIQEEILQKTREVSEDELLDLRHKIANATETNRKASQYSDYIKNKADFDRHSKEYDELTEKLESLVEEKKAAILGAKIPVEGLTFENDRVLYNGIPLSQAGDGERILIFATIAAATIPEDGMRVMLLRNASLLDEKNRQAIYDLGKPENYNFQIFEEVVDSSGKVGIVINDGKVEKIND